MNYNFDEIINRNGTDSVKWDAVERRWGRNDLIPMWVADMDFRTAPFVIDALKKRLDMKCWLYICLQRMGRIHYQLAERTAWLGDSRGYADVYSRHCPRTGICYPLFHGERG